MRFRINGSSARGKLGDAVLELLGEALRINGSEPYDSYGYDVAFEAYRKTMLVLCDGDSTVAGIAMEYLEDNVWHDPSVEGCEWAYTLHPLNAIERAQKELA